MANDQGTFIGYRNAVEGANIVANTPLVAGLGPTNVATTRSDEVWRIDTVANEATTAQIDIDFGSDQSIGALSMQFPRGTYPGVSESAPAFGASDTIRFRLLDSGNSTVYDSTANASGVVAGYMTVLDKLSSPVTARTLRINLDGASRSAAGFYDVSSVGAWRLIEPNVGAAYPAEFAWIPKNDNVATPAGRVYTARFEPLRQWSLAFDALTNDVSLEIDELVRYAAGSRQVLVARGDLPAGKNTMHALMTGRAIQSVTAERRSFAATFNEFI